LPRSILHGDYWPGKFLVSEGQIGVIDVLGWAEGPIWLDIGYYLLQLRAANWQVWLHNVAWPEHLLRQAEDEFLAGYFGVESINPHTRCFFQAFALLAKWSRNSQTLRESTGLQHTKKRASFLWRSMYYRSLMLSFTDMDGV
jgi:aminoglycoside phosphotransferase (APT) family kinase protein